MRISKKNESENMFRCPMCTRLVLRGVKAQVGKGLNKGIMFKVCRRSKCLIEANNGKLDVMKYIMTDLDL